jgi:predicted DCC family thiol-disulfide oxidoreductase YuxK
VSPSDERGPVSHDHRIGRDGSRLTVLYDRDCGICGLTARNLARWDRAGRFSIVPLQSAGGGEDPRLAEVAVRYALADELHVVDSAGRVASGGDAALAIIDALPGGRLLRPWAAFGPFRRLASIGYRWIARHRKQIGRRLGLELDCAVEPAPPAVSAPCRR